jgi:Phospholipase_D-nuclease N-terminal
MIAYVYPILGIFWSMLMFVGLLLVLFMIVWCFVDNFKRRDHHGWAKLGWTLLIVFIPLLGALIYIVARPSDVEDR